MGRHLILYFLTSIFKKNNNGHISFAIINWKKENYTRG
jgi:hypothetical protein